MRMRTAFRCFLVFLVGCALPTGAEEQAAKSNARVLPDTEPTSSGNLKKFRMGLTEATLERDFRALLGAGFNFWKIRNISTGWYNELTVGGAKGQRGQPLKLTYCFPQKLPPYWKKYIKDYEPQGNGSFHPLDKLFPQVKASAARIFAEASRLTRLEIDLVDSIQKCDIALLAMSLLPEADEITTDVEGQAFMPSGSRPLNHDKELWKRLSGDIIIRKDLDAHIRSYATDRYRPVGMVIERFIEHRFEYVLRHEIGHALDLSHPFDPRKAFHLKKELNNGGHTVMSYTTDPRFVFHWRDSSSTVVQDAFSREDRGAPWGFGDAAALAFMYGRPRGSDAVALFGDGGNNYNFSGVGGTLEPAFLNGQSSTCDGPEGHDGVVDAEKLVSYVQRMLSLEEIPPDTLWGPTEAQELGHQLLTGRGGDDYLVIGSGKNDPGDGAGYLHGGSGNDYLEGGGSPDLLVSYADDGADILDGNGGEDYFVLVFQSIPTVEQKAELEQFRKFLAREKRNDETFVFESLGGLSIRNVEHFVVARQTGALPVQLALML